MLFKLNFTSSFDYPLFVLQYKVSLIYEVLIYKRTLQSKASNGSKNSTR